MKRVICVLTIVLIMFVNLGLSSLIHAKGQFEDIRGVVDLNFSKEGTFVVTEEVYLDVKNFVINKSLVRFHGEISYDNNTYPIKLKGDLFKANSFDGFAASFEDLENNFDVIHFSIINSDKIDERELIYHDVKSGTKLLRLYLMRKNTREFIILETKIDNIRGNKHLSFDIINEVNDDEAFDNEFWYHKLIDPIQENLEEVGYWEYSNGNLLSSHNDNVSSEFNILSVPPTSSFIGPDFIQRLYRYSTQRTFSYYDPAWSVWLQLTEKYHIEFITQMNIESYYPTHGFGSNFFSKVFINRKWTETEMGRAPVNSNMLNLGDFGSSKSVKILHSINNSNNNDITFRGYYGYRQNASQRALASNVAKLGAVTSSFATIFNPNSALLATINIVLSNGSDLGLRASEGNLTYHTYDWSLNRKSHAVEFNNHRLTQANALFGLRSRLYINQGINRNLNDNAQIFNMFYVPIYEGSTYRTFMERRDSLRIKQ
ncbi:hypothetical protein HYG86_06170 [Alkalicella caledoniensis]|uniref:Uncharacterized protein n=1 Tax=Alkalicella caledoniensis TaxID=2731377 RepID=A0A7G9W6S3_ALKCA|nr:hypothetical protein [Alkalicella caledoniensis]QNO14385.1 hypothetical protein HYG86_06170 [Alkalicella caledoniensis]